VLCFPSSSTQHHPTPNSHTYNFPSSHAVTAADAKAGEAMAEANSLFTQEDGGMQGFTADGRPTDETYYMVRFVTYAPLLILKKTKTKTKQRQIIQNNIIIFDDE
jgi:hypothetical protein